MHTSIVAFLSGLVVSWVS